LKGVVIQMKSFNWKKNLKGPACYIFGAGEYYEDIKTLTCEENFFEDALLVAADGGFGHLKMAGMVPHICIGDFDSYEGEPEGADIIRLNPIKDTTDMAEAVGYGLKKGFSRFFIFGGTGGRTSHTLANIQTMVKLSKEACEVYIIGNREIFTAITGTKINFTDESEGYISVFAHSESCKGVSEVGLKYEIEDFELTNDYPLGVSNEFVGKNAEIRVKDGTLVIVFSHKAVPAKSIYKI